MPNIVENVANNISKLRKANNLTQIELANKLNYSDKAISKWERGESLPDIGVLNTIAQLFNVDMNYLVAEHTEEEFKKEEIEEKRNFVRDLLVLILWCIAIFFVATFIFIYVHLAKIGNANEYWVAFICATAISCLFVYRYARRNKFEPLSLISSSLSSWTVITSVFCITYVNDMSNVWMLFLIGLPIQAALFIAFFMKKQK